MKVLFIGGTGIISSAVSLLAVERGIELYHFNRGKSHRKIEGVKNIIINIRNIEETKEILAGYSFDVVVNWITFTPEQVKADIEIFTGKTKQYIFISSASAYEKPISKLPITEKTPLINPFWQYSRDKATCEKILMEAYKTSNFPVTIVRPSHTYDNTLIPTDWGYTILDRMLKHNPEHGTGLLGDKSHSVIFDNSKIKKLVPEFQCKIPFSEGAKEIVSWYKNNKDWQVVNEEINTTIEKIIRDYER